VPSCGFALGVGYGEDAWPEDSLKRGRTPISPGEDDKIQIVAAFICQDTCVSLTFPLPRNRTESISNVLGLWVVVFGLPRCGYKKVAALLHWAMVLLFWCLCILLLLLTLPLPLLSIFFVNTAAYQPGHCRPWYVTFSFVCVCVLRSKGYLQLLWEALCKIKIEILCC